MFTDIMIKVAIILLCAGIAFLGLHLYLAYGADADYCSLWAREQTRIDITTAGDFTTLTSTQEMILKQKAKNLLFCKSVETRPQLEGDITILSDEAWSLSVYQLLIA